LKSSLLHEVLSARNANVQCVCISCTFLVPNAPQQKDIVIYLFRMVPLNCCWWHSP